MNIGELEGAKAAIRNSDDTTVIVIEGSDGEVEIEITEDVINDGRLEHIRRLGDKVMVCEGLKQASKEIRDNSECNE